jgi:hypothetical protein
VYACVSLSQFTQDMLPAYTPGSFVIRLLPEVARLKTPIENGAKTH